MIEHRELVELVEMRCLLERIASDWRQTNKIAKTKPSAAVLPR